MSKIQTVEIPEFNPEDMPLSCTWIVIGPPASGKCLNKDTPVLLHSGKIKMVQDITTKDILMGDDSTPRKVLSTTSGQDKMYKITKRQWGNLNFYDKESYVVNEPHILSLLHDKGLDNMDPPKKVEMSVKDYLKLSDPEKGNYSCYRAKVEFRDQQGLERPSSDEEIDVKGETIPFELLTSSVKNRWNILRQIVLEIGSICSKSICITTSNIKFGNEIVFLCRSLGITTNTSTKCIYDVSYAKIKEGIRIYEMDITFGFRSAKHSLSPNTVDRSECTIGYDFDIEYIGIGDYYGFELDGNHRFLLGDFTVTHNTTFMENMAYYRKHVYPTARIFMGTEDGYKRMCKIFHPLYVSNYWDENEEMKHIERQKTCEMENGRGYPGNYAINIIDDVSDDPKIYKTKIMRGLFKLGSQHWAQLAMIGSQYAIDMPPDIRKAVSYVALGREPEEIERKKLYENFGGLAGSYAKFCDLMDQITGDYTFLIFKKRSQSNDLEECVSWYKTKKLGDWKFGCKEYRAHADARYDPNYVEKIMM